MFEPSGSATQHLGLGRQQLFEMVDRVAGSDAAVDGQDCAGYLGGAVARQKDRCVGGVLGQALACGCPVIATPNSGVEDLIEDGREGFVVPIRDPDAIAERLIRLYCDRELLTFMSQNARRRVEHLGGWATYGTAATELFGQLASGWRPVTRVA